MKADFETTSGVVRVHEDGDVSHTGGYSFCVHALIAHGTAHLTGMVLDKPFTFADRDAIWKCLREKGCHTVRWSRRSADGLKIREFSSSL